MEVYEPIGGESISETAEYMVALAKHTKGRVTAKFNGITLTVRPCDNPDAIVQYYRIESKRCREDYENSPEYKRQQDEDLMRESALAVTLEQMRPRDHGGSNS